jgi:cytochrome P450
MPAPLKEFPGPRGLRGVVELLRFIKDPVTALPAAHRRWGDTFKLKTHENDLYFVAHPEAIEQLLVTRHTSMIKDEVLRQLKVMFGEGLLTSEGELWKRQRRLAAPALTRKQVALYADDMVAITRERAAHLAHGAQIDVHHEMMELTLHVVLKTLFGLDPGPESAQVGVGLESAMQFVDRELHTFRAFIPARWETPGRKAFKRDVELLDQVIYTIIARKRQSGAGGDDLLTRLMVATDDDGSGMDDRQLRDEALTVLLAGHETTALALTYGFWMLSREKAVAQALYAEIANVLGDRPATVDDMPALKYADAFVREVLRLYPPAWVVGREAVEPVEIDGFVVPPTGQILASPLVVHRDPRWFADPLLFRPGRWLDGSTADLPRYAYFPFGGGPRVCIGNHFAMMEAVLLLVSILQQVRLSVDPGFTPGFVPSVTMRPSTAVPAVIQRLPTTSTRVAA